MGAAPTLLGYSHILKASCLDTPLGSMTAIADDHALYLLEFSDRHGFQHQVERLKQKIKSVVVPGRTPPIDLIENELARYFENKLKKFKTPLFFLGSPFQNQVWEELKKIPYGETRSYAEVAKAIKKPTAFRAVANANGANQLAIVIPCHRVINTDGRLGG